MKSLGWTWKAGLVGATLLVASACAVAAEIEPGLPARTNTVVTINVKQLLHSPLVKQHAIASLKQASQKTDAIREVLETLGLDPFHDLDRVTIGIMPAGEDDEGVVIVRGRFDTARFRTAARHFVHQHSDRLSLRKDDDLNYVAIADKGERGHGSIIIGAVPNLEKGLVTKVQTKGCPLDAFSKCCVALVDKNTLILASSEELLKEACQHVKDRDTSSLNKPMRRLLTELEPKQTIAFALERTPSEPETAELSEIEEEPKVSHLRDAIGGLTLAEDCTLRCAARTSSIADAKEMMKTFDELRLRADGLATLLAGSNKEYAFVKEIPHCFAAVRKGGVLLVEGHLSAQTLNKILASLTVQGRR